VGESGLNTKKAHITVHYEANPTNFLAETGALSQRITPLKQIIFSSVVRFV